MYLTNNLFKTFIDQEQKYDLIYSFVPLTLFVVRRCTFLTYEMILIIIPKWTMEYIYLILLKGTHHPPHQVVTQDEEKKCLPVPLAFVRRCTLQEIY